MLLLVKEKLVKMIAIITSLLFVINVSADSLIPIKKGETSPFDGYVISQDTEKQMRQTVSDLEFKNNQLKQLGVLNEQQIKLMEQRGEIQAAHNKELSDQLKSSNSLLKSTGYFLLGGLVATIVAYGASHAAR